MNCTFENIPTGEEIDLRISNMHCFLCKHKTSYKGKAVYKGHGIFEDVLHDVFEIYFQCPSCKTQIRQYIEICKEAFDGTCLQEAFKQAGINLKLKSWFQIDNMQELCNSLGLRWYEGTDLELGVEPVIVIYRTSPGKAHAIYTEDIGPYLTYPIVGIIKLKGENNDN